MKMLAQRFFKTAQFVFGKSIVSDLILKRLFLGMGLHELKFSYFLAIHLSGLTAFPFSLSSKYKLG